MAIRFLVGLLLLISVGLPQVQAKDRQEIRFYKANKDGLTSRMWFTTRKSRREGCQNLLKKTRLYKVSQFGYESCSIYANKDCEPESIMTFTARKGKLESTDLSQGYGWQPIGDHERGEKMRSWACVVEANLTD